MDAKTQLQHIEAKKKLIEHLQKNGKDRSWPELTKLFYPNAGNPVWARSVAKNLKFEYKKIDGRETPAEPTLDERVEKLKQEKAINIHRRSNKELSEKVIELQRDLDAAFKIKHYTPEQLAIVPDNKRSTHEATAIVQWSDWHVDEVVDAKTVNSLNRYNPDIAEKRATTLFQNTIKLVNTQRNAVDVPNLVIHLGGDSIGGYIHPELQQTNSMSPLEGIFFAKKLIVNGLNFILNHGKFKRVTIVTSRGNHPRLTPKMQFANDHSMNLETFLYKALADHFSAAKNVFFHIEESELAYLDVYGRKLRFFHGHQIRFKGGIGGVTIPLYKAIHRWNENIPAFYNFMCDKHTYSQPTPDCQLNGSLKGYDAYAVSHGFKYQEPLQSFTLLDSKRGITIKAPIFCQ